MENIHAQQPVLTAGKPLGEAKAAVILLHGRGATAQSILGLGQEIGRGDWVYLAPQAASNVWYPYPFMTPIEGNEPFLSFALARVGEIVDEVVAAGIPHDKIMLVGFSQGACLSSEFLARHPRRYGGLAVLSGGLIGPPGTDFNYTGDLAGTPVFVGCSDVDFHIPLARVQETSVALQRLGAAVTERIYPGMGHTVNDDEIDVMRAMVQALIADS